MENKETKVAVIMGSDSDFPIMKKACEVLKEFGVSFEVLVSSAHRTTDQALTFAADAEKNGFQVIIAGAGAAAHLPGVLAAKTTLPVIGVPIDATPLKGLDALYAIVQMPSGVPVATVAINGAKNAALLAIQMLALGHDELRSKLHAYKENMAQEVMQKNQKLQAQLKQEGYDD